MERQQKIEMPCQELSYTCHSVSQEAMPSNVKVTLEPENVEGRGSHTFSRLFANRWSSGQYITHVAVSLVMPMAGSVSELGSDLPHNPNFVFKSVSNQNARYISHLLVAAYQENQRAIHDLEWPETSICEVRLEEMWSGLDLRRKHLPPHLELLLRLQVQSHPSPWVPWGGFYISHAIISTELCFLLYPVTSASVISRQNWGGCLAEDVTGMELKVMRRERVWVFPPSLSTLICLVCLEVFDSGLGICNKISISLDWHSAQLLWCPFLIFRFPGRSLD